MLLIGQRFVLQISILAKFMSVFHINLEFSIKVSVNLNMEYIYPIRSDSEKKSSEAAI